LSFEFALSYHALIPEAVYTFTSATFEKKKAKQYSNYYGTFTYRDVPSAAYGYGIRLHNENGYSFQIATPEKAVCDELYQAAPVEKLSDLEELLFDDLRLSPDEFFRLDKDSLTDLAVKYRCKNLNLLQLYIKRKTGLFAVHGKEE
jgi:hypothetical protein